MNGQRLILSLFILLFSHQASSAKRVKSVRHRHRHRHRRAEAEDVVRDFAPLNCNRNIDSATCQSWTSVFGTTQNVFTSRVVVPCGTCVIMNQTNADLTFNDGIDIIGKLVIPDGYKVNIYTTMIVVQGVLEIISTSPVTGTPNVQIVMIGNNTQQSFTPADTNVNACVGDKTCLAGKKAIIVAGGTVNLHGIPPDSPTWVHLYDVSFFGADMILLPKSIFGKWTAGAEILITSHTMVWNETQVRRIQWVSSFFSSNKDYVMVRLNETIVRPTTLRESPDFAVEVALLSRNIAFIGGPDDVDDHGGHMMITYTPLVQQTIEGVDFRNFGQQGNLGRYPIHFHFSNDVSGSIVAKNTIRQSNQRCVVVHGTNKLRIEQNVAFDTKGHCYMTEDGIETGNEFLYNLGAQTGIPAKIIPNEGPNGNETDGAPATFWITNPTNIFIGNVAAGSQHSGFWFEPKLRGVRATLYPNYNPMFEPLTLFKDNVAHSNSARTLGAIRMYTPGYRPKVWAVLDGLKVFRNVGVGIFIHRDHNIRVQNSLFADNAIGIDIDRSEGIEVTRTIVIGESSSYRLLQARQKVLSVCTGGRRRNLVGIDLHTWKTNASLAGATISDVEFHGFNQSAGCEAVSTVSFDPNTLKGGIFEFYSSFRNISFYTNVLGTSIAAIDKRLNLCLVQEEKFDTVYLIDLDGSFTPSTLVADSQSPSTLLASDDDTLLTFVDKSKCTNIPTGCYNYCQNTCFRSVRYLFEGFDQENLSLKICKRDEPTLCATFRGGRRGDAGPHEFIAHLPVGNDYDSSFLYSSGKEVTSGKLIESYEPSLCPGGEFNVTLVVPILNSIKVSDAVIQDTINDGDDDEYNV